MRTCIATCLLLMISCSASAQTQFFNSGSVAFEPEIDTVTTGAQMIVQPTVSADRKYVTISGQFQTSQVIAIETYQVQQFTTGNTRVPAGLLGAAVPMPPSRANPDNLQVSRPALIRTPGPGPILNQHGMILVASLH